MRVQAAVKRVKSIIREKSVLVRMDAIASMESGRKSVGAVMNTVALNRE